MIWESSFCRLKKRLMDLKMFRYATVSLLLIVIASVEEVYKVSEEILDELWKDEEDYLIIVVCEL